MRVVKILSLIAVFATLFSSCGNSTGSGENTFKVDYINFTCLKTLEGDSDWVYSVAFSPDGTKIVSGSMDKTIKIWGVE
jgi:WD40 repeat protein